MPRRTAATIILIDQQPLREDAFARARGAMAELDGLRARWHHFERKDKPAFARWRAREFGRLLSEARETENEIQRCRELIHEIEMEMRRGFYDPQTAYQRVMARKGDQSSAAHDQAARGAEKSRVSDFEKEALFQEWVRRSLGTNPDKMDDAAYSQSFENFKSHMFRAASEEQSPREPTRRHPPRSAVHEESRDQSAEPAVDPRLKQLYRRLVRRLHPDLRTDGSVAASAIWHEVQQAYLAGDVAQMELLLALSDIETEQAGEQSLAQMRALAAELERSRRALEKRLHEAEGEDGWDFARLGATAELASRVDRELQLNLRQRKQRLVSLQSVLDEWKHRPRGNFEVKLQGYTYTR